MATDFGERIDVEVAHERYQQLSLYVGASVFLFPRDMKLFVDGGDAQAAHRAAREYLEREARNLSPAGP